MSIGDRSGIPNNRFLIYATSEIGHHNYELFVCDADSGETGTVQRGMALGGDVSRTLRDLMGFLYLMLLESG